MDYIEGLFLGKLWSDTDFENRKHIGLFVLYGLLCDVIILYAYLLGKSFPGIFLFGAIQFVLFILLFVANPFICFRYYRMPLWGKVLVLLERFFHSYLVLDYTVSLLLPKLSVQSSDLSTFLIDLLNGTLEPYTEKFAGSSGSFSTVIGDLAGGVHVVLVACLGIIIAIAVPGLIYLAYRLIQFCWDWLMNVLIIKRFIPDRR